MVHHSDSLLGVAIYAQQPNPRQQPDAPITIYTPEQHDLYDGLFSLSAGRIYYIRSPRQDARNRPNREVCMHFFGMEVTWK